MHMLCTSLAQISSCRYCRLGVALLCAGAAIIESEALQNAAFTAVLQRIDMNRQLLADFHIFAVPAFTREYARRWQFDQPFLSRVLRSDNFERDPAMGIGPLELLYGTFERNRFHHVKQREAMMRISGRNNGNDGACAEHRSQKSFAHAELPDFEMRSECYASWRRNDTVNKDCLAGSESLRQHHGEAVPVQR